VILSYDECIDGVGEGIQQYKHIDGRNKEQAINVYITVAKRLVGLHCIIYIVCFPPASLLTSGAATSHHDPVLSCRLHQW